MDNAEAPQAVLRDCEVMFLDFLGFSEAVKTWNPPRLERLIALLVGIAANQSIFDLKGETLGDGSYKIKSRADITTFSDNIVVSYPLVARPDYIPAEVWPVIANGWQSMVREQMQKIATHIFMAGLNEGLLVRGGLTRGNLYHHGAVVIGEAMIEAYNLERSAGGARIVVSDRITDDDRLLVDEDGKRCLEFLPPLMLLADDRYGDAKRWAADRLTVIDQTIIALQAQGCAKAVTKWEKFRDELNYVRDTW